MKFPSRPPDMMTRRGPPRPFENGITREPLPSRTSFRSIQLSATAAEGTMSAIAAASRYLTFGEYVVRPPADRAYDRVCEAPRPHDVGTRGRACFGGGGGMDRVVAIRICRRLG